MSEPSQSESRAATPLADERRFLLFAFALSIAGALAHLLCIPDALRERSDLPHYLDAAVRWAIDGAVPYREIPFEYPPAALLFLRAPVALVATGLVHYDSALALVLAPFDALALFAALLISYRSDRSRNRALGSLAFAWVALLICGSLLFTRFDLAPAALLALSVALVANSPGGAGASLGAACALKLYPFWAAPALAIGLWRAIDGKKKVAIATISGLAAALALSLPAMLPAGLASLSFLGYHGARGLQFQSLWGSLWMVLGQLGWVRVELAYAFGSNEVVSAPRWLSLVATVLPIAWMVLVACRARRLSASSAALAALCGFVALGKIGSPQFSIVLAPLAAGCLFEAPFAALAILVSIGLGAWQFPFHHQELVESRGVWPAVVLLRMLLVLAAGSSLLYQRSRASQ